VSETTRFQLVSKTLSHLKALGRGIGVDPVAVPGLYAITLSDGGERSFTYWRSASAARKLFGDGDFSALEGFDLVYLSGISLAILPHSARLDLIAYLAKSGQRVAYDNNHRPGLWGVEEAREVTAAFWSIADIPLPSIDDELALFGESESDVRARFSSASGLGAMKCGAEGPFSIGEVIDQTYTAASRVIDTTSAGDSFNGGYLAARLRGRTQAEALRAGHELAAKVVAYRGAIIPKSEM